MIMVHNVTEEMLALDLNGETIAFDDGLLSVAFHMESITERWKDSHKIICISPELVDVSPTRAKSIRDIDQSKLLPPEDAMELYLTYNDRSHYMSNELIQLLLENGFEFALHGYSHNVIISTNGFRSLATGPEWRKKYFHMIPERVHKYYKVGSILSHSGHRLEKGELIPYPDDDRIALIHEEIRKGREWAYDNHGVIPNKFCLPFNSTDIILSDILDHYNFTVLGGERIAIEQILE